MNKIPFEKHALLKFKDIERCPYVPRDSQYSQWHMEDDRRLSLIALDRYADYLCGIEDDLTTRYKN